MGEENDDDGRPEEFPPERVMTVFTKNDDDCEPMTAREIADRIGSGRRTALNKLERLVEAERLRSKKVGGRSRVFWRPDPGGEADAP